VVTAGNRFVTATLPADVRTARTTQGALAAGREAHTARAGASNYFFTGAFCLSGQQVHIPGQLQHADHPALHSVEHPSSPHCTLQLGAPEPPVWHESQLPDPPANGHTPASNADTTSSWDRWIETPQCCDRPRTGTSR
jgi:hypothetical protein